MPDKLPKGWVKTTLGEVAESMKNGIYKPASFYADDGIACLRMYNIADGEITWRDVKRMRLSEDEIREYELVTGDLLVNRVNSRELVGKSATIPEGLERCVFESKNIRVRLRREMVSPAFVNYRLLLAGSAYFSQNAQQVVGMASVNQPQVSRFPLPLPPRAEQERIVAKLDALLSRVAAGEAAARRALDRLKRYRAAVLHAAVTGELTRDWRKQQHETRNSKLETGAQLLERLLAARRARWEEAELKRLHAAGKTPTDDKWKKRYPEAAMPTLRDARTLPSGWIWASVEQAGEVKLGRQRAPQHHRGEHMRPYLRVANVFEDRIDVSDVMKMNFTPSEFETYALRFGDILLNEGQSPELVGRPAMYRDEIPGCCFQKTLLRFRAEEGVNRAYALIVFRAYLHNGRFRKSASITTSIGHLAAERFVRIEVPLPPTSEQTEIVSEVSRRLAAADQLAVTLQRQLARARMLRQSLLREAFAGRLVPQDPREESAAVLLERLRAAPAGRVPSRGNAGFTRGDRSATPNAGSGDPVHNNAPLRAVRRRHEIHPTRQSD